jgi:hypothetical protein
MFQIKSATLGAILVMPGITAAFAQEKELPQQNSLSPATLAPLKINWTKTPFDRDIIKTIEPALIDALTALGRRDTVTIGLSDSLGFVRAAVSPSNTVQLNRSFLKRSLSSCESAGLDKETSGRVVAFLLAPTIMHELKHVEDLIFLKASVKEPLFYIGGKEEEALAHRQQGLAVAKLIESGYWSEVESAAMKVVEAHRNNPKIELLSVAQEIMWYHRRRESLPSLIQALPSGYDDKPSLFDRAALIRSNLEVKKNGSLGLLLAANPEKGESLSKSIEATDRVLADPAKFQAFLEAVSELIDQDAHNFVNNSRSSEISLNEIVMTSKDAAYARKLGEPFEPGSGLSKFTGLFLTELQRDPKLISNNQEIRLLTDGLVHSIDQLMTKSSSVGMSTNLYIRLASAIGISSTEQRSTLEKVLLAQEATVAKLKRLSADAGDTESDFYQRPIEEREKALKELRLLVDSIKK